MGKVERRILDVLKAWEPRHKDTKECEYKFDCSVNEIARYVEDMGLEEGDDWHRYPNRFNLQNNLYVGSHS